MGKFTAFIRWALGPPSVIDMFDGSPRDGLHALSQIERMSPTEAVPMLLNGISQHSSDGVRCHCIRALLPFELSDAQIDILAGVLEHPSAKVRHTAVSFFGLRGSQKRPVTRVVPKLVRMLEVPNESTRGDWEDEMFAKLGLPGAIAAALGTTVGAEKLMVDYESRDMESFRKQLVELKSSTDPVLRSDANKYLGVLFGD